MRNRMKASLQKAEDTLNTFSIKEAALGEIRLGEKIIAIRSSSPGAGATTILNHVSKILATKDLSVVVVDLNKNSRNTSLCPDSNYSFNSYLSSNLGIRNFVNSTKYTNIKYIGPADDDDILIPYPLFTMSPIYLF